MKLDFLPREIESVVDFFFKPKELSSPIVDVQPIVTEPVTCQRRTLTRIVPSEESTEDIKMFANSPIGMKMVSYIRSRLAMPYGPNLAICRGQVSPSFLHEKFQKHFLDLDANVTNVEFSS
ncbi:hypothetical protein NPIL_330521 [Nephila pilipes]|uniref:Uncharacterized protein n=1 Tax=Nephila pilipes TaxID=299642 RepID=A0A8X6TG23_NEPPI|nr:hypothetical protein NPIL_330521 [Nephila pilipes]